MKRSLAIALAVAMLVAGPAQAATLAKNVTTKAKVSGDLEMTLNAYLGSVAPANKIADPLTADFGTLADLGTGTLRTPKAIFYLITMNSHKVAYNLKQTATAFKKGADTLAPETFVVLPDYQASDNGSASNEGTLGTKGGAVAVDKLIYTSGGTHSIRTVRAIYQISDDPADGVTGGKFVPLDQVAGDYAGTLTFTLSA